MKKQLLFLDYESRKSRCSYYRTNLAIRRRSLQLSQSDLSALSGVSVRLIQHYEQGEKDINKASVSTLYKLSVPLLCSINDLLEFI